MVEILIRPYEEKDREALENFHISEEQHTFTSLPIEVLDAAVDDKDRFPTVVVNEDNQIVGFFQLHRHYQHVGYATPEDAIYIRSLSVDENYQGRGYGTMIAMQLPLYVQENFGEFEHFYLAVDGDNVAAWNLYERAGFIYVAIKEDGPIGEERLYYLDLNQKYVPNVKLKLTHECPNFKANIILNHKDIIGVVEGVSKGEVFYLNHIEVDEDKRNKGYASSSLRQLPALLRRFCKDVNVIEVDGEALGAGHEMMKRVGYSKFTDDTLKYKKYIK